MLQDVCDGSVTPRISGSAGLRPENQSNKLLGIRDRFGRGLLDFHTLESSIGLVDYKRQADLVRSPSDPVRAVITPHHMNLCTLP